VKNLVLVGGGHSHAIALRLFALNPIPGVRLVLVSDNRYTPYSGMLPGHLAGFYTYEETHIDLAKLANFAQAEFCLDQAMGLDPQGKVIVAHNPPISFDYLSIDIGSTPAIETVVGAKEYAIAVKPVPQFLLAWNRLLDQVKNHPTQPLNIAIVGGGAGGVEIALNIEPPLREVLGKNLKIHLFHRGKKLLPNHNFWVRQKIEKICQQRGIDLHLEEKIIQVSSDQVKCESGLIVQCHPVFWVTQASSPHWIKASGLTTDSQGFILVKDTLQSLSHPHIFACGDIATMENHPRPKAGVFAVRQGKPLFENLTRSLQQQPLKSYIPQKLYLGLIGTGKQTGNTGGAPSAIASWGWFAWESKRLWRWKDRIDRRFMDLFK